MLPLKIKTTQNPSLTAQERHVLPLLWSSDHHLSVLTLFGTPIHCFDIALWCILPLGTVYVHFLYLSSIIVSVFYMAEPWEWTFLVSCAFSRSPTITLEKPNGMLFKFDFRVKGRSIMSLRRNLTLLHLRKKRAEGWLTACILVMAKPLSPNWWSTSVLTKLVMKFGRQQKLSMLMTNRGFMRWLVYRHFKWRILTSLLMWTRRWDEIKHLIVSDDAQKMSNKLDNMLMVFIIHSLHEDYESAQNQTLKNPNIPIVRN